MQLKKLQISGFKSFVDTTDVRLPAGLVAVVGPNGCGKSNLIDAVRWVMGESSAKMLRGDNMADVIFNGSSSRKPISKASVELLFDNSDGSAGGNFSQFADISIKRTLSRDGNSNYFINQIKTRRKDVLDLFRGTGLGPRSYAIIEQGMVNRIVEGHPEYLRRLVEEAAGTSNYKDRRKETETHINQTIENLQTVSSMKEQIAKQLRRLKRQASEAKRYKNLKEKQRATNGCLLFLELAEMKQKLAVQSGLSVQHEHDLKVALVNQQETEAELEQRRQQQLKHQEKYNQAQQERYQLDAEINNIEQKIGYKSEGKQSQKEEEERVRLQQEKLKQQLETDESRQLQRRTEIADIAPQIETLEQSRQHAEAQLADVENAIGTWQSGWETFNEQLQVSARQHEVQQSRIAQLQQHLQRSSEQTTRIEQEIDVTRQQLGAIDIDARRLEVKQHDEICEQSELEFRQFESVVYSLQESIQEKTEANANLKARRYEVQSRLSSLKQIQEATLNVDDETLQNWLLSRRIDEQERLATRIHVKDGWERAVDRLMDGFLGAYCVAALPESISTDRPDCTLTLITDTSGTPSTTNAPSGSMRLLDKLDSGKTDLSTFLDGVYAAESLDDAIAMQSDLRGSECTVTRDGVLVGNNWISFAGQSQLETGVLVREEEMQLLQKKLEELATSADTLEYEILQLEQKLNEMRQKAQQQQENLNQLRQDQRKMHSTLAHEDAHYVEAKQRVETMGNEIIDLNKHVQSDEGEIDKAQQLSNIAATLTQSLESERVEFIKQREKNKNVLENCKEELHKINNQLHKCALKKQRVDAELASTDSEISRAENQLELAAKQLDQVQAQANQQDASITNLKENLRNIEKKYTVVEQRFSVLIERVAEIDNNVKSLNNRLEIHIGSVEKTREQLHQHNMTRQEISVRCDTKADQIESEGYDQEWLESELPEDATIDKWRSRSEEFQNEIDRIGAVNLVAIEEFEKEREHKEYLDAQHADLSEALDTLRDAIRKIDNEMQTRFKKIFEQLNEHFKDFFPNMFGGGRAELQLTDDTLMTAGVIVMAQPPGKRNSHIHLLSGGEKALTAVALLFAFFKLNPSPFCMLDEVDAALDDTNVERYCQILNSLTEFSRFIVVTHNKITMQAASALIGVTMSEPGVSRLVSVDIDEAMSIAAQ